jgi:hypothetical protein
LIATLRPASARRSDFQQPLTLEAMESAVHASGQIGFPRWILGHQTSDHVVAWGCGRRQHAKETIIKPIDGSAATSSQHEQLRP